MKSIIKEMCLFASLSTKGSVENASKFYLNLLRKIQPKNPPQEALLKRLKSTVNGIVSLSASPSKDINIPTKTGIRYYYSLNIIRHSAYIGIEKTGPNAFTMYFIDRSVLGDLWSIDGLPSHGTNVVSVTKEEAQSILRHGALRKDSLAFAKWFNKKFRHKKFYLPRNFLPTKGNCITPAKRQVIGTCTHASIKALLKLTCEEQKLFCDNQDNNYLWLKRQLSNLQLEQLHAIGQIKSGLTPREYVLLKCKLAWKSLKIETGQQGLKSRRAFIEKAKLKRDDIPHLESDTGFKNCPPLLNKL